MNIVPRPEIAPGQCLATLKNEDPLGFVDTGLTPPVVDPRVYVSVSWILECAGKLGWTAPDVLEEQIDRTTVAENRALELEQELVEADKVTQAVYTLKNNGFTASKKPGRPAKAA